MLHPPHRAILLHELKVQIADAFLVQQLTHVALWRVSSPKIISRDPIRTHECGLDWWAADVGIGVTIGREIPAEEQGDDQKRAYSESGWRQGQFRGYCKCSHLVDWCSAFDIAEKGLFLCAPSPAGNG